MRKIYGVYILVVPETELLEFCKKKNVVSLAFAPLGHGKGRGRSKIRSFRPLPQE